MQDTYTRYRARWWLQVTLQCSFFSYTGDPKSGTKNSPGPLQYSPPFRKHLLAQYLREFAWDLTLTHSYTTNPMEPLCHSIGKEIARCSRQNWRKSSALAQTCFSPLLSLPSLTLSALIASSLGAGPTLNISLQRIWCKQDSDLEA